MDSNDCKNAFLAVLLLAAACAPPAAPVAAPPAPVPQAPVIVADPSPLEELTVCVVHGGAMSTVSVSYNHATGDSVYQGRRFRDAFPTDSSFAASARWYHDYEPIVLNGRRYIIYGLPRALRPGDVVARGEYRGVTVFVEPTASRSSPPEVLFLPVRPTCEFQPYEPGETGGAVRGR